MQTADNFDIDGAHVLSQKVMVFCHLLRAHGMGVTAGRIIDTFRALKTIHVFRRDDFYMALQCNLVSKQTDLEMFDGLFQQFWSRPAGAIMPDTCLPDGEDEWRLPPDSLVTSSWQFEPVRGDTAALDDAEPRQRLAMYSPIEVLSRKDFGNMSESELAQVRRLITSMARQMATAWSRRKKARTTSHVIDQARTMRHSLRYGGEVIDLKRRGPKVGKTKMVVLCDISGSMDVYAKFLLQFLYGVQNGLRGVETLVFSTQLTRVTSLLRRRHIDAALALMSEAVQDWSGGTKIGHCIREFNDTMAPNMVTSKTVVVIISDGWDTGDTAILDAEMARLQARSSRIVWLNPLLGNPDYQPLCKGMHTAIPYIHDFMPVHNVESLRQFGRLVAEVV